MSPRLLNPRDICIPIYDSISIAPRLIFSNGLISEFILTTCLMTTFIKAFRSLALLSAA